jgi:translation initiation factor 2-alpha kinase 4
MLFPRSQHYRSGAVRLLDASGNQLQLPFDLTLPNARSISRQDPPLEKTFAFGTVYREMPHGSEPRTHKEVDFDIVSHNTLDLALKEAEVIKVLDEIIEEFPPLRSSPMSFLINHSDLLQLIMEFCRILANGRCRRSEVNSDRQPSESPLHRWTTWPDLILEVRFTFHFTKQWLMHIRHS